MQNTTNGIQIKQEEAFFNKKHKWHRINESKRNENKVNLLDKHGKVSHSVICHLKLDWTYKCPHRNDQNNVNVAEDIDYKVEEYNLFYWQKKFQTKKYLY